MAKNNLRKNFIWNAVGLTLNSANSFFFLIAVRYINGMDIAGIFTYAFALCALFYIISFYFNRSFQVSDSHNKFSFNDYFTCRIILSIVSLVLIFLFSLINGFPIYEIAVILLLMLFRITESISDCFYGAIHKKSHLYQTGISLSLKAICGLIAFTLVDYFTHNLLLAISMLTIVNLVIFFIYDSRNYRKLYTEKVKLNFTNLKLILKTCFPVFLFSALSLYLTNCQKYIMPYFESNEAQTIFGILVMPATVLGLIGSYLINPVIEPLTKHFEKRNFVKYISSSKKILLSLVGVGFFAIVGFYFLGIPFLNLLYHLDLSAYRIPLTLIIIGSIFAAASMIISSLLTILKENRRQTYLYIITAVLATLISIFFIKSFGIAGASYAFLISNSILIILYIALLQITIHQNRKSHAK